LIKQEIYLSKKYFAVDITINIIAIESRLY